jgi:hypothetical protein
VGAEMPLACQLNHDLKGALERAWQFPRAEIPNLTKDRN